jgi:hypothetical protein
MGKVHRIKKSFTKVVATKPWETLVRGSVKGYSLNGYTSMHVGVRWDGSWYIGYYGEHYKSLLQKLIKEYEAGVALGDKTPIKE